ALLQGQLDGAGELLADHRGHAAAQERELKHRERDRVAADAGGAGEHRLLHRGLGSRRLEAVGVALGVLEAERILRAQARLALLEGALVGDRGAALARRDAERVAALGAHAHGALDLRAIDDLATGVALDPEALGDHHLLRPVLLAVLLLLPEPGHASSRPAAAP